MALASQLDLLGRTAELARTFGIDFFSVLSRGSQYRVESLLVRLAHSQNYIMISPTREQVWQIAHGFRNMHAARYVCHRETKAN